METSRLLFKKTGRARYISHLDLNRTMQRSLRRAGIPVWVTQGFNPHPYITFLLPLPLGCESVCEVMDFRLPEDCTMPPEEIVSRLNGSLPEGIEAMRVGKAEFKETDVAAARYRMVLFFEDAPEARLRQGFDALLRLPSVAVDKKSKRGVRSVELKPYLDAAQPAFADNRLELALTLPAGPQENVSPILIRTGLYENGLRAAVCRMTRLAVLNADGRQLV